MERPVSLDAHVPERPQGDRLSMSESALPIVLLHVGTDDGALDACLGALDSATPAGTRVWLIDDAQAGPRGQAVIAHWLERTPMLAEYTRRQYAVGESRHVHEALKICGESDVVVLPSDAIPLEGWLHTLQACFERDASIATATPWSNIGEVASWPRLDDLNPLPENPERLARAVHAMPALHPELPSACAHAVLIRGKAYGKAGGVDDASFHSWPAALADLSLRLSGLGWRNALCETAFVARIHEPAVDGEDQEALIARWPAWHARMVQFLLEDPLKDARTLVLQKLLNLDARGPQPDLFA